MTNQATSQPLQTLKGFRDFLPQEKRQRDFVLKKIIEVFELFGFEPLETPTLEYASLLLGKYGAEADKLVYTFQDRGEREVGLRYDQTVPTARVLAQYQNNLPKFFRRYQIQNVFRADKPQKGRYREFVHCDIDIFGSNSPTADAEILACTYQALRNIGFEEVQLVMNDRRQLIQQLESFATKEVSVYSIIQSIDKLDKQTESQVKQELQTKGLTKDTVSKLFELFNSMQPTANLQTIQAQAAKLGVSKEDMLFSPTLARGLDYYTGLIFEVILPQSGGISSGGGGRYDNLIEDLCQVSIPAVGMAFGFDRVVEAAVEADLIPNFQASFQVLVAAISQEAKEMALEVSQQLRQAKIAALPYLENDDLSKQLKFANQQQIPWVVIIGEDELAGNQVVLKNMETGEQQTVSPQEISKILTS